MLKCVAVSQTAFCTLGSLPEAAIPGLRPPIGLPTLVHPVSTVSATSP